MKWVKSVFPRAGYNQQQGRQARPQAHAIGRAHAPVLRNNDVRRGHPLHVRAEAEEGVLLLGRNVQQEQPPPLVAEEQLAARLVQLQPVNLGIVLNGGQRCARCEVHHRDGARVNEIRHLLVLVCRRRAAAADADAQDVRVHVLRAHAAEDLQQGGIVGGIGGGGGGDSAQTGRVGWVWLHLKQCL